MLRGYRIYHIVGGTNPHLTGMFQWPWMNNEMQAECLRDEPVGYAAMAEYESNAVRQQEAHDHLMSDQCHCGIYAVYDHNHYLENDPAYIPIWAAVIGWGAAVKAEHGWRAQFVKIEHLWLLPKCRFCPIEELSPFVWFHYPLPEMMAQKVCKGEILFNTLHGGFLCEKHSEESHTDRKHFITMKTLASRLSNRYDVPVKIISKPEEIA